MRTPYEVKLSTFEGPLDLLLHLINELEIDIYDIPVSEITDQYMAYIKEMQEIELDIASEYLVMAATLLQMKSAMLLPKQEIEYEDEYEEDPREQLIQRLIEYERFKQAAEKLKEKELDENQLYTRPPIIFEELMEQSEPLQGEVPVYEMIHALKNVLQRKKWNEPLETTVTRMEISIEERMDEIVALLKEKKDQVAFDELFPFPNREHIVTTFLAVLQLLKANAIECYQKEHFQPIIIRRMEGDE